MKRVKIRILSCGWDSAKFWWLIPTTMKYNHTELEQENQKWWPRTGTASARPGFQNLSKMARKCSSFGCFGCPKSSWREPFAREQTQMMNRHLGALCNSCCTRLVDSMTPFWGPKYTKSAFKVVLYAYLFRSHLPSLGKSDFVLEGGGVMGAPKKLRGECWKRAPITGAIISFAAKGARRKVLPRALEGKFCQCWSTHQG